MMPFPFRPARLGVTLIELLVAMTICMILAVVSSFGFVEAMRARDEAQRRLEATANARHAIESMGLEVRRARLLPATAVGTTTNPLYIVPFSLTQTVLPTGNNRDLDGDGVADEEADDGLDNDGDWVVSAHDDHAAIPFFGGGGNVFERPLYGGVPDLGDRRVDEDSRFNRSELLFETFPISGGPPRRAVRFHLDDDPDEPQGAPLTLFRTIFEFNPVTGAVTSNTGVLARNVLSFTALAYDMAQPPPNSRWQTTWEVPPRLPFRALFAEIPVSVYLALEVYAGGPRQYPELASNEKVPTVRLSTVVNVEAVLADPRNTFLRPANHAVIP